MKKISTIILLLLGVIFNANAQQRSCEDMCSIGPDQAFKYVICTGKYSGTYKQKGSGAPVTVSNIDLDYVYVIISYNIITCPNGDAIQINSTCYIDHSASMISGPVWIAAGPNGETTDPASTKLVPPASSCITPTALQAQMDAINALVTNLGLKRNVDVYYKGICSSTIEILWPKNSYNEFNVTNETTAGSTTSFMRINMSNTKSLISIPCDEGCCKVTYFYKIRTTSNGYTESYYESLYKPVENDCTSNPNPDYNSYNNKLTAYIDDPVNGKTQIFGEVISQTSCEATCLKYTAPPPPSTFTTGTNGVEGKQTTLEFSANPTVVIDYIKFTSNKNIAKIMVFNMAGKKVMNVSAPENNELNTSELKQGTYFIQVYFTDNQVKTIKVVKP
jgi:hypothetical protein